MIIEVELRWSIRTVAFQQANINTVLFEYVHNYGLVLRFI